jgi:hypothetical protein
VERDIQLCKARLTLCVSGPLREVVARAGTAKEAWDDLREEYLGDLHPRKPRLMADLLELKQDGTSVMAYIDKAKALRDEFEDLEQEASLPLLCQKFLHGLDSNVLRTCGPILSRKLRRKDVCLDELCSELRDMLQFIPEAGGAVNAARGEQGRRVQS